MPRSREAIRCRAIGAKKSVGFAALTLLVATSIIHAQEQSVSFDGWRGLFRAVDRELGEAVEQQIDLGNPKNRAHGELVVAYRLMSAYAVALHERFDPETNYGDHNPIFSIDCRLTPDACPGKEIPERIQELLQGIEEESWLNGGAGLKTDDHLEAIVCAAAEDRYRRAVECLERASRTDAADPFGLRVEIGRLFQCSEDLREALETLEESDCQKSD